MTVRTFLWLLFIVSLPATASSQRLTSSLTLAFDWQYHYDVPRIDTVAFTTVNGQSFSISALRYYVGNVSLQNADGSTVHKQGYYLVGNDEEGKGAFVLDSIPEGSYTSISFIVGVDSADNVTGPMEGDLDPLHGMYWTWATGYIFFKLEGASPSSPQPRNIIEYHLGGFSAPYNNIQRITLPLRRPLAITTSQQPVLEIGFDVGAFINADGGIDFATTSSVTDAKHAAPLTPRLKGAFRVR